MEEFVLTFDTILVILGPIATIVTLSVQSRKDKQAAVIEQTEMKSDIRNMSEVLVKLADTTDETRAFQRSVVERIAVVEAETKAINKRLDSHISSMHK